MKMDTEEKDTGGRLRIRKIKYVKDGNPRVLELLG